MGRINDFLRPIVYRFENNNVKAKKRVFILWYLTHKRHNNEEKVLAKILKIKRK